jgi:hypothetical protein
MLDSELERNLKLQPILNVILLIILILNFLALGLVIYKRL